MKADSTPAWITLTAGVVAYDLWALRTGRESLSAGFYRAITHPKARWPVIVAWAYLTVHLFVGPRWRWDPLRLAFR